MPIITLPENNKKLSAAAGTNLLDVLKENGIYPDALCLGAGAVGCAGSAFMKQNKRENSQNRGFSR